MSDNNPKPSAPETTPKQPANAPEENKSTKKKMVMMTKGQVTAPFDPKTAEYLAKNGWEKA